MEASREKLGYMLKERENCNKWTLDKGLATRRTQRQSPGLRWSEMRLAQIEDEQNDAEGISRERNGGYAQIEGGRGWALNIQANQLAD